jgi:hypothetical protein
VGEGQVENQVGLVRERFFTPRLRFASYEEMNTWLLDRCLEHANTHRHPELRDRTVADVFRGREAGADRVCRRWRSTASTPSPPRSPRRCWCGSTTTSIRWRRALGRPVEVHAYSDRVVIRQGDDIVAEHDRRFGREQTVYDPWHYVPVQRRSRALRNGAPFKQLALPPALERLRSKLKGSDDGDRQMVKILTAAPVDGLDALEAAAAEALAQGVTSADVVLNILARSRSAPMEPSITTPEHLQRKIEPVADAGRYDQLLPVRRAA